MPAARTVRVGKGEWRIDPGCPELPRPKQLHQAVEWRAPRIQLLHGPQVDQPEALQDRDPDRGTRARRAPRGRRAGEIDAKESRFAHRVSLTTGCV